MINITEKIWCGELIYLPLVKLGVPVDFAWIEGVIMPRKKWIPKNKYCPASRLSTECFIYLVECYMRMETAKHAQLTVKEKGLGNMSRQTVTTYYLRFGHYLFYNFYMMHLGIQNISTRLRKPYLFAGGGFLEIWGNQASLSYPRYKLLEKVLEEDESPDSIKRLIANSLIYVMQYQSYLRDENMSEDDGVAFIPDNRFIVSVLRKDMAASKGFDNDRFDYHFGRAYFMDTVVSSCFQDLRKEYVGRDNELLENPDVLSKFVAVFLGMLEKNPL